MIRTSEAITELSAAWVEAAAAMPNVPKETAGQVGNVVRKYADLATLVETVRPILAGHGLAYVQGVSDGDKVVTVTTRLVHKSGEWLEDSMSMPTGQNTPQAVGSATTYCRRYSLMAILGLAPDDDDGTAASAAPATRPAAARKPSGPAMASEGQIAKLAATFKDWGVTDRDERLKHLARILKRSIPSSKDLTVQECSEAIDTIELAIRMDADRQIDVVGTDKV